jgi:hypothetical protein
MLEAARRVGVGTAVCRRCIRRECLDHVIVLDDEPWGFVNAADALCDGVSCPRAG